MGSSFFYKSLFVFMAIRHVSCASYSLSTNLVGETFINAFYFQTLTDPNGGRARYVDLPTAQSNNLVSIGGNGQITLSADSTTVLSPSGPGRMSFNLYGKQGYGTHVAVFDIVHMPEGCGTWPAACTLSELGPNWPAGGEIDIVEGVNNLSPNSITLHTGANCTMPANRDMIGEARGTNCDANETGNTSCGTSVTAPNSYGPSFNSAGGGWYAIERTDSFISIYFWTRNSPSVPENVKNPGNTVDTSTWGTPTAYYPSTSTCDLASHVGELHIVIDLNLCGSWAGNPQIYKQSGCPSTCTDYVNSNPAGFKNAYFEFNSIRVYE